MKCWLNRLEKDVPAGLKTPAELARFELENALPGVRVELKEEKDLGDAVVCATRGWMIPTKEM